MQEFTTSLVSQFQSARYRNVLPLHNMQSQTIDSIRAEAELAATTPTLTRKHTQPTPQSNPRSHINYLNPVTLNESEKGEGAHVAQVNRQMFPFRTMPVS
jgi:hypothetical protein